MEDVQCKNCQWYERYAERDWCEWTTYNLPQPLNYFLQEKEYRGEVDGEENRRCGTYKAKHGE